MQRCGCDFPPARRPGGGFWVRECEFCGATWTDRWDVVRVRPVVAGRAATMWAHHSFTEFYLTGRGDHLSLGFLLSPQHAVTVGCA